MQIDAKTTRQVNILRRIIDVGKQLRDIQDFDVLLERLLSESRLLVYADAGSIYISEGNQIRIRYAQNDTQRAKLKPGEKLPFMSFAFPVDEKSVAGYVVTSSQFVNLPDCYNIADKYPFSFNKSSDEATGYHTTSMLTTPLIGTRGKIFGVLQLINATDDEGKVIPFDDDAELFINHFAETVSMTLERAYLNRLMVMRIIEMARFRDPKETGAHVSRVSNYAIEIYDRWAFNHAVPIDDAEAFRDALKIAATLHDVGKVAISDVILKKPGRFTPDEYAIVKAHTCIGAHLFDDMATDTDSMSRDVALHHHEFWDGNGYPGDVDVDAVYHNNTINPGPILQTQGMQGESIPLAARIVAVADVFDALCSKRVYKDAWTIDDAIAEIRAQRGIQFDPDVVDTFDSILPTIRKIRDAWPDD